MKVAFIADTHFGYPRFEQDAGVQGAEAILDAAAKADVLLLGGDIFDCRVPRLETLAEVAQLLASAKTALEKKSGGTIKAENLILGIHGTHERRGKDMLNPLQMMARLGLMADVHNRTCIVQKGGEKAAFSGMGGVPDDLVKDALARLSCKKESGAVNFFLFHQTMHEFVPQAPGLASLEDLPEGYDWYLCGHIHKRMELMGGKLLIPGSTVITQLRDEEGGAKGYFLIDTESKKSEWVEIKSRRMEILDISLSGQQPSEARKMVEDAVFNLAKKTHGENPIVRVKISGKLAPGAGSLDITGISCEGMEVFFDNSLDGDDIASQIEKLKEQRAMRATPSEIGKAVLAENAAKAGISRQRCDELFVKFSED
jgi:DNA repair exonuclease SbcCD nuclease subunit